MSSKTTSTDDANALGSLRSLRKRLEIENPAFRAASALERGADRFVSRIRLELKARRKRLRWDQADLGGRLGYSQSTISKLESGQAELSLKALYRMAAAMGLHPVIAFVPAVRPQAGLEREAETTESARAEEAARAFEEAQAAMIKQVADAMTPMAELVAGVANETSDRPLVAAGVE